MTTAASLSATWVRASSNACCNSAAASDGAIRRRSGRTSGRWIRQARPSDLLRALAGRSGVPAEMYASFRSAGKYGGRATWPSWPAFSRSRSPKSEPSNSSARNGRLAVLEGQAEGFEVPAVLAVPGPGQGLQGLAGPGGRDPSEGQDQLAADPRVGVVGHRQEVLEVGHRRRRLLGLGLGEDDGADPADVAAEDPDGLFANPRGRRPSARRRRRRRLDRVRTQRARAW